MGLTGAAVGFNNTLQQVLADRYAQQLAERQYQDHLRQQQFDNDMKVQQFQSNEELKRAQLDATAEARKQATQQHERDYAVKLDDTIPAGAIPYAPETEGTIAALKGLNAGTDADERPAVETGPLLPGDTGAALPKRFIKTLSAKQQKDADELARKTQADATNADIKQQLADIKQQQADRGPKEPTPHFTVQQSYDEKGQPNGLVKINTLTGEVTPVANAPNIKTAPGAAAAAQGERSKHEALTSLDQLDQAIEQAKDLIGPGAGRISKLEQMIGSQDPRLNALATKLLLVKMQVDHAAAGSVRAGASPMILQRWDNILGSQVTPEGLKAGVQAMREILGGGQTQTNGGGTKPTAEDLIKKYGGR